MFKLFLDDWSGKEFISRPIPEAEEFATIKKESDWFYGIDNAISDFLADRAPVPGLQLAEKNTLFSFTTA